MVHTLTAEKHCIAASERHASKAWQAVLQQHQKLMGSAAIKTLWQAPMIHYRELDMHSQAELLALLKVNESSVASCQRSTVQRPYTSS